MQKKEKKTVKVESNKIEMETIVQNNLVGKYSQDQIFDILDEWLKTMPDIDIKYDHVMVLQLEKKIYLVKSDVHLIMVGIQHYYENHLDENDKKETLQQFFVGIMKTLFKDHRENMEPISLFNKGMLGLYQTQGIVQDPYHLLEKSKSTSLLEKSEKKCKK